ncbi:unnamed protein product [Musa acuminata subsp. burmannicoides]
MTRRTSFLRLTWWIESITTLNATVLLDLLYPVTTSTGFGPDRRRSRLVFIWRVTTKTLHEIARRPPLFARSGEAMGSDEKEASDLSYSSVPLISLPNRTPPIPSRFRCPSCSLDFFQLQMILSLRLLVSYLP